LFDQQFIARAGGAPARATVTFLSNVHTLLLLVNKLEVLGALQGVVRLVLALDTLETEHNLLGGLGLLVEDRLGLATVTLLLAVIATLTWTFQTVDRQKLPS